MSFAHLTLPTRNVESTALFFERTLGYARRTPPANSPVETQWLDLPSDQQIHIVHAEGFSVSVFEGEFGRHVAVRVDEREFDALKARLQAEGAEVFLPLRPTPFARFFFREPINGYVFEVLPEAIHLDQ